MANENTLSLKKNAPVETSGDTVTVACKLPHGLILHVYKKETMREPSPGGVYRDVDVWHRFGKEIAIKGWSHGQNHAPPCDIIGGYAMTYGVLKEHWDLWLSQHRNDPMVENGLIFANSVQKVDGQAKEQSIIRSGLERLDPKNLPSKRVAADTEQMSAGQSQFA